MQTEKTIGNFTAILETAGSILEKVVKTTVFLVDMKDFTLANQVCSKFFKHNPARSCVAVKELPKGLSVEIESVAVT